jgi:K(+)-stimulated pyrophosphate-energized sodium pump
VILNLAIVAPVAGMGADLFESYVGSIVAAIAIGVLMKDPQRAASAIVLPLLIAASGIIASIVGVAYVSLPGALSVPWSYRA